ncbi:MAG: hypothetical protein ACQETE_06205 [Bacteroidota bacterium]
MKTLYLAWQDKGKTRRWFPIGRLDADIKEPIFKFGYIKGAERAKKEAGFQPLDAFPDFEKRYISSELFPLFKNRVINQGRDEFRSYLEQLDLDESNADPISILEVSGGTRRTDNLEVFPKISKNDKGEFCTRFFLRGWRYVNKHSKKRVQVLEKGEKLGVSIELNNPATGVAVQLLTDDYCMVGWTPRFLVNDILDCISEDPMKINAKVVKVNPAPAPSQERVLIQVEGEWPKNYEPMSGPDFKALWKKSFNWFK